MPVNDFYIIFVLIDFKKNQTVFFVLSFCSNDNPVVRLAHRFVLTVQICVVKSHRKDFTTLLWSQVAMVKKIFLKDILFNDNRLPFST